MAVRIARTITRATRRFIPFKINPDLYTSWQMATESGAEITQSTASGRLRVVYVVKSDEISLGIKKNIPILLAGVEEIRGGIKEFERLQRKYEPSFKLSKDIEMIFGCLEMSAILE